MIIQPEHAHEQTPPQVQKPIEPPKTSKVSPQKVSKPQQVPPMVGPPASQSYKPPDILTQMLSNSLQLLPESTSEEVRQKMKYMEQKVHFSFSQGPNQYLKHLRAKRKPQTEEVVKQIIDIENWLACNSIWNNKTKLYERGQVAKNLKGQISNKLSDMKKSMMSLSSIDKKANAYVQNLLQFRKKNYWLNQNESSKKVKTFLSKMKRIQSQQKKRYESQLVKNQYKMQVSLEKQKLREEETKKKIHSMHLEKQIQWRKQRQRQFEEDRKKKQQIEAYLQKYHQDKPIHVKLEQYYIKNILEPMEEQREKKLEQIKQAHQPIQMDEIQQHQQKYNEYKESLMEQHRKKDQQFLQSNTQLQQNLKELFHSRFHSKIEPRFYNSAREGHIQARKKVKDYAQLVLDNHKPRVDPAKRQKIQETIKQLELKEDKKKIKVRQEDGSIVIQERPECNAYRIGVQYLEKLKQQSQGKPRKRQDRSASMIQMPASTRVKRIDYLRENKPKLNFKKTIGEWKKVVGDASFSPREKYEFIMEQAAVMQEKSMMKEAQMRSYKKGERALELKGQMDKYYAESVAAKMVVLKDVIMKQ